MLITFRLFHFFAACPPLARLQCWLRIPFAMANDSIRHPVRRKRGSETRAKSFDMRAYIQRSALYIHIYRTPWLTITFEFVHKSYFRFGAIINCSKRNSRKRCSTTWNRFTVVRSSAGERRTSFRPAARMLKAEIQMRSATD